MTTKRMTNGSKMPADRRVASRSRIVLRSGASTPSLGVSALVFIRRPRRAAGRSRRRRKGFDEGRSENLVFIHRVPRQLRDDATTAHYEDAVREPEHLLDVR